MELKSKKIITNEIYIPYGLEIEAESIPYEEGKRVLSHKVEADWKIGVDNTLIDQGIEISTPVLTNKKENYTRLKKIASTLKFLKATFKNASFQINFDIMDLKQEKILDLLKMYAVFEHIVYRFSRGNHENLRKNIFDWTCPISNLFFDRYQMNAQDYDKYKRFINTKTFGISLKTRTRNISDPLLLVEFRTPDGCDDYDIWMNYITFFSAFLTYVKGSNYDKSYIDYMFNKKYFITTDRLTDIDEVGALKLASMIYTNEEDKENFYKQYFSENKRVRNRNII